jgi:hypothetical protein
MQPFDADSVPTYRNAFGLQTDFGIQVPIGAQYCFVGPDSSQVPISMKNRFYSSITAAMPFARANKGDCIFVLPGHTENVSSTWTSTLVAGTHIIGLSDVRESGAPTLTWNAVGSTIALSVANVRIANLRLIMGGADDVTRGVNVTAAGCCIDNCYINFGTTAVLNALVGIEIGAAAHSFRLSNNRIVGEILGAVTDGILVSGVANDVEIVGNRMFFATGAVTTGNIRIAAAALRMTIDSNTITNSIAASETCIGCGAFAATGVVSNNFVASEAGTPVSDLIEFNAASLLRCFQNFGTDTKNTSGLLTPAVVT